jgi:hypothetical protein
MERKRLVGLIIFIFLPVVAQAAIENTAVAQTADASEANYILCKNQKTVRTIRIENANSDKKCVAWYTKAGVDKEVCRAQSAANCLKIVDNIKMNLEAANWKCKEVGKVRITSSNDE